MRREIQERNEMGAAGVRMTNPEIICKVLDELDPIIDELAEEYCLDAEDIETVLDTLKEKFRASP